MPVGSIISYYGVLTDPNYLLCDGSLYDIVAYSSLYSVLKSPNTPDL
jgi:microcystin-dependent protein